MRFARGVIAPVVRCLVLAGGRYEDWRVRRSINPVSSGQRAIVERTLAFSCGRAMTKRISIAMGERARRLIIALPFSA